MPAVRSRWLVRFGYDGSGYDGWARQPGRRTVEGEILRRLAGSSGGAAPVLEVASRTDRGVSARANALGLWSSLDGPILLRRLNAISPDLYFTAAVRIPSEFRVRAAHSRIYRYWDPSPEGAPGAWRAAAAELRGSIDARSFGRGLPQEAPRLVPIESIRVRRVGSGRMIEVRARSFVWGMVRKIVGAMRSHAAGRLTLGRLAAAAAGHSPLSLPMAEAEGLVLWDVRYPIRWSVRWAGPNRYQRTRWEEEERDEWVRHRVRSAWTGHHRPVGPSDG